MISAAPDSGPLPGAIFLDAAGTLFSIREPVGQTYARIAAGHGIFVDANKMDAAFRSAWRSVPSPAHPEGSHTLDDDKSWWRILVRHAFADVLGGPNMPPGFESAFEETYSHYASHHAWHLHDDVRPALLKLSRHARLFVLSNFDRRLHTILNGFGIKDCFERIIVSSEVGAPKPHARMFRTALSACGLPASECLHVGDDPRADHGGATAVGLACFLVQRPEITLTTLTEKLASGAFPACIGGIGG